MLFMDSTSAIAQNNIQSCFQSRLNILIAYQNIIWINRHQIQVAMVLIPLLEG